MNEFSAMQKAMYSTFVPIKWVIEAVFWISAGLVLMFLVSFVRTVELYRIKTSDLKELNKELEIQ